MPKNKLQGVVFGILMSITMAIGMEVYNVAVKMGYPCLADSHNMDRNCNEKFSHGTVVESVCRRSRYKMDVPNTFCR